MAQAQAKVKAEDDASDGGGPSATFDEDDLQELYAKHAVKDRYPPGCEVWHGLTTAGSKRMEARRGVVQGVYVDLGSGGRVYKIARGSGNDEDGKSSVFVAQDQLTYAMGCPVNVKGMDESDPDQEWEGNIVCPRPGRGDRSLAYSVQFLREGRDGVRVELGVDAGRISFRRAEEGISGGAAKKCTRDVVQSTSSSGGAEETEMNGDKQQKTASVGAKSISASSDANDKQPQPPPVQDPRGNDELIPGVLPSISDESHGAMKWKPPGQVASEREQNLTVGSKAVADAAAQKASLSTALSAPRKRTPPTDFSSLSSESLERPQKRSKGEMAYYRAQEETGATCILTVPLWVQDGENDDQLFHHLIGRGGQKTKAIRAKTNCSINLTRSNLQSGKPTVISIKSEDAPPSYRDVTIAKRMVEDSLAEYIDDANSEALLIYELALSAAGTYYTHTHNQRGEDGTVRCQLTDQLLWTKLLELPSAEVRGELVPHGRFLLGQNAQQELVGDTSCSIDAYCFGESIPRLGSPYVLVCGDKKLEVNEVAERVADAIDDHMQGCSFRCRFFDA